MNKLVKAGEYTHPMFGGLSTLKNESGEIYFIAKEICQMLGYSNVSDTISKHCKGYIKMLHPTNGGMQEVVMIPERDLYRLVMRSKKEEAIYFEEWVVSDVLPSIRKHGMYATDMTIENMINDPDFAIGLLNKLKEEKQLRIEVEKKNAILMHVNKTYTATEVAKELGLASANKLNEILCDKKIQYKQNGTWIPYGKYSELGYFDIKQDVLDNGHVIYHRRITQLGRDFILNLFNK